MPAKIPKEAVLYVLRPEVQYTCDKCVFNKQPTKCAIFGQVADIKPYGSCGFFIHLDPQHGKRRGPALVVDSIPWLGLITKEEAGYDENRQGFSCKRCEYFLPGGDCKKVDKDSKGDTPGIIHPNACCNAWEADDQRAKISTTAFQLPAKSNGRYSLKKMLEK